MTTLTDRQAATAQAARWLNDPNALILDTETTGVGGSAEIIQLAVMDMQGTVLLDALVQPVGPISPEAAALHGITADRLRLAAPITAFVPLLTWLFRGRTIVIYNAAFDQRLLTQSLMQRQLVAPDLAVLFACQFVCAMDLYAQWVGEWNHHYKSYRWQRLPGGDHTALGDCRATLAVLKAMAGGDG